jgi:molybdopterin synthase sulfur carrier subunit
LRHALIDATPRRGEDFGVIRISFASSLERFLPCPPRAVEAATVREALDAVVKDDPRLGAYLVDEQGRLRTHVAVFVGGAFVRDRETLSDRVSDGAEIYVLQALSGG